MPAGQFPQVGHSTVLSSTSSSILSCNAREKARQKMSSAVGVPFDHIYRSSPHKACSSGITSSKSIQAAGTMMKQRPPSSQRFLATAYDSNWTLRQEIVDLEHERLNDVKTECNSWLHGVLGKRKKKEPRMSSKIRPDLISTILEDGGITDKPWAWDPLRDLKMLGMQDSRRSSESSSSASSEALDIGTLAVVARWGRRRSAMRDSHLQRRSSIQRRSSKANTFRFREKEKPTEVKKPAPEIFTLQKLSSRHNIPFQVSEQAFSWWFQFAKPESFLGTREDVVDGMEFDIPSLGLMSHDTFVKACCAISDVDDPKLLDMEFVGSVLLRAAEYLESATTSLDPQDESLDGHLDFAEFLTFFHKFSFSEEVLINRQERELRRLARKHGFSFLDIDALKKDFDKVDRKGEGKLKQDEFLELMARLMKLPPGQEIPSKKKWTNEAGIWYMKLSKSF